MPRNGDLVLAREAHRRDLALGAARAEAHRDEDRVGVRDALGHAVLLDRLGVDEGRSRRWHSFAMPPCVSASLRLL